MTYQIGDAMVRIPRTKTAWELNNPIEIIELEFKKNKSSEIDLAPSFYFVSSESTREKIDLIISICAEHLVSFVMPKPFQISHIIDGKDASVGRWNGSPGETLFAYTTDNHFELQFDRISDLKTFIESIVKEIQKYLYPVRRDEIMEYAAREIRGESSEWVAAAGKRNFDKWESECRKLIALSEAETKKTRIYKPAK